MEDFVDHEFVPGSNSSTVGKTGPCASHPPIAYSLLFTIATAKSVRLVGIGGFVPHALVFGRAAPEGGKAVGESPPPGTPPPTHISPFSVPLSVTLHAVSTVGL